MRLWHTELVPKLCQKHLCAMWREGLGCWAIVRGNKQGYRNHPATKEWIGDDLGLYMRLCHVRCEMLRRGYNPKHIPCTHIEFLRLTGVQNPEWQTLEQQIEILKAKGCKCNV